MSLPELRSEDAKGNIKLIYQAIENALGVRLVNLVYRHLATVPGTLEWSWGIVSEPFQNGVFAARASALTADLFIPEFNRLAASKNCVPGRWLDGDDRRRICETLDAYNRANPMNAISLRVISLALQNGRPAQFRAPKSLRSQSLPDLLPLASLEGLPPEVMSVLNTLAHHTAGKATQIVPSLYRHFVEWPKFLEELGVWLELMSEEGTIDVISSRALTGANEIAENVYQELVSPPPEASVPNSEIRSTLVETIKIFPSTICRMIVIGGMLRAALKNP